VQTFVKTLAQTLPQPKLGQHFKPQLKINKQPHKNLKEGINLAHRISPHANHFIHNFPISFFLFFFLFFSFFFTFLREQTSSSYYAPVYAYAQSNELTPHSFGF